MQPFVIRGDLSCIHADVIVYGVGCFLLHGYLASSLKKRYGSYFHEYLKNKFSVSKPKGLPQRSERKKFDYSNIRELGGLEQGFTSFFSEDEMRGIKNGSDNAPAMLLAVVGGEYDDHINADSVTKLVRNIFATLSKIYNDPQKKITIAFPSFGTGKGRSQRSSVVKAQLQTMQEQLQIYPHLQPIFVSYSDTLHRMALDVKQKLSLTDASFLTKHKMNSLLTEVQDELSNDRLILFVGAGVSQSSGLPSWQELVTKLADKANIEITSKLNAEQLLDVSEQCREQLSNTFANTLRDLIKTPDGKFFPSIIHYLLSVLPINTIVTTNFDDLLEKSLLRIKKTAFAIHNAFDVARAPIKDQVNVLKIHGDAQKPSDIIFTKKDYENYFERRPAVSALLKGYFLNRTFLFIGYSLRDPNLNIILDEVKVLLRDAQRSVYMVVFDASEDEISSYEEKGINILALSGNTLWEKTISLWSLLDTLQCKCFQLRETWLAKDAVVEEKWQSDFDSLRNVLDNLAKKLEKEVDLPDEMVDFVLPWLSLAMKNGMSISPDLWEKIARHYRERPEQIEAIKLNALASEIEAFRSSDGKRQLRHETRIWQMRKEWHKKNDKK